MSVLCFGNIQFDVLCRSVVVLPVPGEIRVIDAIDVAISGNAGSMAAVLARLGITAEIAGYSGHDIVGEQVRSTLEGIGVHIDKLLPHPTANSGISVITLNPEGERSIMIVNGVNELFDLENVPDQWLQNVDIVSVQSVFLLPQFTGEAIAHLFARARAYGARTLLNICWDNQRQGLTFLQPALKENDYFVLNADEGQQLTGQSMPEAILKTFSEYTSATVLLTLWADGCCWLEDHTIRYVKALPVNAIDCTGAGDSFIAGFCAGLTNGRSVRDCARLGCATSSFAVTGPGAYARVPLLKDLDELVAQAY